MPGRISGRVTTRNVQTRLAPSVPAASSSRGSTASIGEPDGAHHQRERHDRAGERRAGPAEREDDAEAARAACADRPAPAEGEQQQVAGDDRRQDQRQVHQPVQQLACPRSGRAPAPARPATPSGRLAERRPERDLERQQRPRSTPAASQVIGISRATVKPCASKTRLRLGRGEIVEKAAAAPSGARGGRAPPDRRSADGCPRGRCRRPSRWSRRRRRWRRRCRAAPRRARPAPAPRARSRPAPRWSATPSQTPRLSSAALPYLPAGTAVDVGHRQPAVAERAGEVEARRDRRPAPASGAGATSTMRLPSRLRARRRVDQVALLEVVHPVEVGGEEDVGRRALLDLLGQRRAGGVADRRGVAGRLGPVGRDRVERVLQAGRGEDHDVRRPGAAGAARPARPPRARLRRSTERMIATPLDRISAGHIGRSPAARQALFPAGHIARAPPRSAAISSRGGGGGLGLEPPVGGEHLGAELGEASRRRAPAPPRAVATSGAR